MVESQINRTVRGGTERAWFAVILSQEQFGSRRAMAECQNICDIANIRGFIDICSTA